MDKEETAGSTTPAWIALLSFFCVHVSLFAGVTWAILRLEQIFAPYAEYPWLTSTITDPFAFIADMPIAGLALFLLPILGAVLLASDNKNESTLWIIVIGELIFATYCAFVLCLPIIQIYSVPGY